MFYNTLFFMTKLKDILSEEEREQLENLEDPLEDEEDLLEEE